MLSLARSGNQIGIQQAHFPDVCYPAQGFTIGSVDEEKLATAYGPIPVTRLTATMGARQEPITYWLTMADQVVKTQWEKRIVQIRMFLDRREPWRAPVPRLVDRPGLRARIRDPAEVRRRHDGFDFSGSAPQAERAALSNLSSDKAC